MAQAIAESTGLMSERQMMTQQQVISLAKSGFDIGAHTVNHPILTAETLEVARREIMDS